MSLKDEISAAIGAHGSWKTRLRTAIESGTSEFSPSNVGVDNKCVFGKWLHAVTDRQVTASPEYQKCRSLHRDFHALAAKVLSLALDGKKAEAEKMMAPGGNYAALSSSLTRAMMEWQQKA